MECTPLCHHLHENAARPRRFLFTLRAWLRMYSLSQAASTIHLSQVRWGGAASEFSFSLASLICYPGGSLSGHWLFVVAARRNRSQQDKHAIAGGAAGKVATRQVLAVCANCRVPM